MGEQSVGHIHTGVEFQRAPMLCDRLVVPADDVIYISQVGVVARRERIELRRPPRLRQFFLPPPHRSQAVQSVVVVDNRRGRVELQGALKFLSRSGPIEVADAPGDSQLDVRLGQGVVEFERRQRRLLRLPDRFVPGHEAPEGARPVVLRQSGEGWRVVRIECEGLLQILLALGQ